MKSKQKNINIANETKFVLFGDDNENTSTFHFIAVIAFICGIALQIYCVIKGNRFDLADYGLGIGALLSGLGLGKKLDK